MKKYATLLLTRIHTIYTMQTKKGEPYFIHNGFIAIHHDTILEVGVGSYQHHIDKDTRVVDCYNRIVTPSFIEVCGNMEAMQDLCSTHERLMQYHRFGTCCINVREPLSKAFDRQCFYTVTNQIPKSSMPIVYAIEELTKAHPKKRKRFCLSTYHKDYMLCNTLLAAQLVYALHICDAYSLLQAMTIHPANCLQLHRQGRIAKGMLANLLVFSVEDLHDVFHRFDQNCLSQIIHKGVRVYPHILV